MAEFHRDNPAQEQEFYKELQRREATYKRAKQAISKEDAMRASSIAKAFQKLFDKNKRLILLKNFIIL